MLSYLYGTKFGFRHPEPSTLLDFCNRVPSKGRNVRSAVYGRVNVSRKSLRKLRRQVRLVVLALGRREDDSQLPLPFTVALRALRICEWIHREPFMRETTQRSFATSRLRDGEVEEGAFFEASLFEDER